MRRGPHAVAAEMLGLVGRQPVAPVDEHVLLSVPGIERAVAMRLITTSLSVRYSSTLSLAAVAAIPNRDTR